MKKSISNFIIIILLLSISACGQSQENNSKDSFINYKAIKKYPEPAGYVNDFESLFSIKEKQQLDSIINEFEKQSNNQIAIVTIASVKPYETLKDFTTDLGIYWGVGQTDLDNGLIITVSKNMRNIWIGSGLGTEKILTDEILKDIIDTKIIPYFKTGDYFEGIKLGLMECINNWK
jgi:uncharacterized protein